MKLTLLLSICMLAVQAIGQSLEVERLKNEIDQHPQQDTFRVNRLNELGLTDDLPVDEMEKLSNEALLISRKINYTTGEGYALLNLGSATSLMGRRQASAILLSKADSIAKKTGDQELTVYVLLRTARNIQTTDNKGALQYSLKAEETAQKTGNKKLLSVCQRLIASIYQNSLSDYARSMEYALKSVSSSEEANCQECLARAFAGLGSLYNFIGDQESSLFYYQKAIDANKKLGNKTLERTLLNNIGERYRHMGNYPEAIKNYNEAMEGETQPLQLEINESNLADVYTRMDSLPLAFKYGFSSLATAQKINDDEGISWIYGILSRAYLKKQMADSAIYYAQHGLDIAKAVGTIEFMRDNAGALADAYIFKQDFKNSYNYYRLYINYRDSVLNAEISNKSNVLQYNYNLQKQQAQITALNQQRKIQQNFLISALIVLLLIVITAILLLRNNRQKQKANKLLQKQKHEIDDKAHELSVQKDNLERSYSNVELLGEIGRKITSSLSVEKIISTVYDNVNSLMDASVFGIGIYNDDLKRLEFPATYENGEALSFYSNSIYDEDRLASVCFMGKKEIIIYDLEKEHRNYLQNIYTIHDSLQPASLIYLPLKARDKIMGVITVQSFKLNAYSAYHLFMLQNIAIYTAIALENAEAYEKLNHTVVSLKKTQSQLIQSEKMASLGELTSGIAHEIQNPLNFVTNFSEINAELINELEEEAGKGNIDGIKTIAKNIKENEEKINRHGKRADAIVKGMLLHAHVNTGQKELTDINALSNEYLRLSYHGVRAKDKSFNADFKTDFDKSLGKIDVIPQDIGRVLLNLFNNAFYAVNEKKKSYELSAMSYEPLVSIQTKKLNDKIEIRVEDNGNGIPQNIIDKIFQPFFTTKPSGQGTGLGLSLAYDIIKAHGGEIKAETREGQESIFIITLPIT